MFAFILNLPYTAIGLLLSLISYPKTIRWNREPYAMVLDVKSFWWAVGYMKRARAMVIGHVVLLGSKLENKDLEHELAHVSQHQRMPIIQPILYTVELFKKGYRNNKYEIEAYQKTGNIYKVINENT